MYVVPKTLAGTKKPARWGTLRQSDNALERTLSSVPRLYESTGNGSPARGWLLWANSQSVHCTVCQIPTSESRSHVGKKSFAHQGWSKVLWYNPCLRWLLQCNESVVENSEVRQVAQALPPGIHRHMSTRWERKINQSYTAPENATDTPFKKMLNRMPKP